MCGIHKTRYGIESEVRDKYTSSRSYPDLTFLAGLESSAYDLLLTVQSLIFFDIFQINKGKMQPKRI